ncbi:alpha/beta fold hydrolase [Kocuria sp. SM24M-10]|uniref:alpha/beta fold hydrolase n=1 Tax=Kocuria sp. SM24M-10 TaxID=1660349 RepID=UPI000B0DD2B7|nr:alpha/beta hydrolase [Kocuria sp. SM24M-10]
MSGRLTSGTVPRGRTTAPWVLLSGAAVAALSGAVRFLIPVSRTADGPAGVRTDDGVELWTETLGRADAPVTVVFAHGFASGAQEFRYQCQALERRARVVIFDQRGHGRSGWRTYRSASIGRLGQDLGEVIDQQAGEGPIVLVGHSMGGMAVISLAGQRPELFGGRITGVALLSTAAGHLPRMEMPDRVAHVAVRAGLAQAAAWSLWLLAPVIDRVAPFRRPWGRRWLLKQLFGDDPPSPEVFSGVQDTLARTQQSVVSAFYPAMVAYHRTDSLSVFRRIPTLVLTGDRDRTIPWQRGKFLAETIGDRTRFVSVPGAGHMVNLTHPQAVNDALAELLDRPETAPRPSASS